MKNQVRLITLLLSILFCLCLEEHHSFLLTPNLVVQEISTKVDDNENYLKAEFSGEESDVNHFFKYTFSSAPQSKISAFRFEFDQFSDVALQLYRVYCSFVPESTSDQDLMETVAKLDDKTSSCVGKFNEFGIYDGIIKHSDDTKKKLGIYIATTANMKFTARVFLRITEKILGTSETTAMEDETYSLVPYTVIISTFRDLSKSKILFYSYTRELQMYYTELSTPYPEKLFSGNIMSVFTNPNMVHQKYHDANTMVLLTNPFAAPQMVGEKFKFQVKLFDSNFLLDYYVSSNANGRPLNSPLLINMTDCSSSYYAILNYNTPEDERKLYIDQIYGKIRSISVASKLSRTTWEEMLEQDMTDIDINSRKHVLPANSRQHLDVYKIECDMPLLLNFYYVDETAELKELDSGDVTILSLKSYENVNIPFKSSIVSPEIIVDIFSPSGDIAVIINDGMNEVVYQENTLIKLMPMTLNSGITVKERAGSTNTRVIIKVGYSTFDGWETVSEYIKYNKDLRTYLFTFPNDNDKLNYTYANLVTSGTNSEDNVKYCITTNIGSALKPSQENCYRVSSTNSYTLKVYNPLILYKDYYYDDQLAYYVTLKTTKDQDQMTINPVMVKYDTNDRNLEGISHKVTIDSNQQASSIITPPRRNDLSLFIQIAICDTSSSASPVKNTLINPIDNSIVATEETISGSAKNYYRKVENNLFENELKLSGYPNTNVFIKHVGLPSTYTPSFAEFTISFDQTKNEININTPFSNQETMTYWVLVDKNSIISNKGFTLCSFVDVKIETLASYTKKISASSNKVTSVQINFKKIGLNVGDSFEAIVFAEQINNGQMAFLSPVLQGTVGQIETEVVNEIVDVYSEDSDYVYKSMTASLDEMTYYFSYMPSTVFDVKVGALGIEVDQGVDVSFSSVDCAFVDDGVDAMTMVEAVEDAIENDKSYCIGSQSTVNKFRYRYIFKYETTSDNKPKRLVIKLSKGANVKGGFKIFVKQTNNVYLEPTDFNTLKEYGRDEEAKKSPIPYIVDLAQLRGNDKQSNYVSRVLIYSQYLEMQMYYLDNESNVPKILFTGNIMLVLTKLTLAEQKYHATKLILLSENLSGQEHASLGDTFRFHTKMFKSDAQIEYFVSANPNGRTLNFPLSLEMNTCTQENNKYYYILNYNQAESNRILYLDMIYGSFKKARIVSQINQEKWDTLISNSMVEISNYQTVLSTQSQHMDIVEIECNSPLLINAYYTETTPSYDSLKDGDIAIIALNGYQTKTVTLDQSKQSTFRYSVSLFNPTEKPDAVIGFSDGMTEHHFTENSLETGLVMTTPSYFYINNNVATQTRIIFKIGIDVEEDWHEDSKDIEGNLYAKDNMYVYKFPSGNNRLNFTKVSILVNSLNNLENVKFCYSTNLGMAIKTSQENCFRTGRYIPYELTFVSPAIVAKNYKTSSENYYISLKPMDEDHFISLTFTENKYETTDRNIEGQHNILTLRNSKARTILSLPSESTTQILVNLQVCTAGTEPLPYVNYNAYTHDITTSGKVYESDPYGIYYLTTNTTLENELEITGGSSVQVFTKHAAIGDYKLNLQQFRATFDKTKNVVSIVKPIFYEEFLITVLVAKKGKLSDISLCKLASTPKEQYKTFADYVNTFSSVKSDTVVHYIEFKDFGYEVGTEFDLLVYAEQKLNSKMEFKYPVLSGEVGQVEGVVEVNDIIEHENEYVTKDFVFDYTSNYLYYDFKSVPNGKVASLKLISSAKKISKVGCVFVPDGSTEAEMISRVNACMREGTSACIGDSQNDSDGFDALIKADIETGKSRLVMQVIYGFAEEEERKLKAKANGNYNEENEETQIVTINIRINGYTLGVNEGKFGEEEAYAPIPYVIDLLKIREQQIGQGDYVSKVMLYSSTREMQMYYIGKTTYTPALLFSGNIMLIYTNEELIKQKYFGATTMILITDSLSATERRILGEDYRFRMKFFNSASTINYFVSGNPDGRLLNNPTAIEMLSCDQPYYYILNYNFPEDEKRKMHIDTIFGEIGDIKLATSLTHEDWDSLVGAMEPFEGEEVLLPYSSFHIDILEVNCRLPLLLNIYYSNPDSPKTQGLEVGDMSIFSLSPSQSKTLYFKSGQAGPFVYSFNLFKEGGNKKANIQVTFPDETTVDGTDNGVFIKDSLQNYEYLVVKNEDTSGSISTRIIFKFGYVIESTFAKIQNNIYNNYNVENRTDNLFGYKFKTNEEKLNFTSIDFVVSTEEANVKFCYSTNLGTYINPSFQNCYRVGKQNSYTISVLNPLVMYKNYYDGQVSNYYVGFRTVDLLQNITITPKENRYPTNERNLEGSKNVIRLTSDTEPYSTILTAPKKHEEFIFVHVHVCTPRAGVSVSYLNAYNQSNLGYDSEIAPNTKNNFRTINNTKLDTQLVLKGEKNVQIYVRHIGITERYQPLVKEIDLTYNKETHKINFTQPIEGEEFKYTIYLDKKNNLKNQGYTLCSITESTKLAHFSDTITSSEASPEYVFDFSKAELKGYEQFDVMILAEETGKGKFSVLSAVYNSDGEKYDGDDWDDDGDDGSSNTGFIVIIVILSIVIIGGAVVAFIFFKKARSKGQMKSAVVAKATSLAEINSAPNEQMTTSQVDP